MSQTDPAPPPTLWIVHSTYLKTGDDLAATTPRHREWLDAHYRSGVFLTSGRKVDGTGGVLVCRAESETELHALFQDDPFVQGGFAEYQFMAFTPVKRGRALDLDGVPLVE
ncbi:Uncharacterized conserved protein YciI, contains a putative active-site phosphohistidine [Deinococcus reticulitermitis]|uniref:Uncharacterized conserved protein YciI, contains a putative active-site phosphohistidine n=1 Tax=Deinococcus reticulitermitis TaxID=856736 RepID=A0A1H7AGL4_9DEIO|nr:YciI family protein [Deinococcus reticulitermitis]SEJ63694.1 Uncharacterized conserved protein YciI, contains a putative active-site phosphohistidine [Deinococcus reticulitermitis]